MANKIWIIDWHTESGDSGAEGYWTSKPTKEILDAHASTYFPDDHEAGTFYYRIIELKELESDG